jgi:hypothetical protein
VWSRPIASHCRRFPTEAPGMVDAPHSFGPLPGRPQERSTHDDVEKRNHSGAGGSLLGRDCRGPGPRIQHAAGRTEQSLGAEAGSAEPHGSQPSRAQPTQSGQTLRAGRTAHRHDAPRADPGSDTTLRPRDSGSTDCWWDDSNALRDCTWGRRTASLSRDCKGPRALLGEPGGRLDGPLPARAPSAP